MSTLNETTAKQNQAHSLAIDNSKLDEALTHLYQSQTKINKQMVINTLTQAKVLVPIALSSEAKSNAQGELIIDKDTQITLILLQNEQGANYCPVFTNETELSKYGAQKSGTLKQGFINIAQTVLKPNSNIAGIVVNPFGVSLTLDSDLLKAITNPVIKDPTPRSYKIESGTKVMIGEPKTYPTKMVEIIKAVLENHNCVNNAWLRLMIRPQNEMSYLIVIDSKDEDLTHLFSDLAQLCEPYSDKIPLDFIKYKPESNFDTSAVKGAKPFFTRMRKKFLGIF
jgi:hypothetical protein